MSFTESLQQMVDENRNGLLGKHSSWSRVELKLVASVLNGFAFSSSQFNKGQGTPLLRIRDILEDHTETKYRGDFDPMYLVRAGELLIGMDGDFNSAIWRGPDALLNQRVCKLRISESFYNLKLIVYALPGYLKAINDSTSSITVKHLSSRTVEEIPLPLPPRIEQDRIVAEIEKQFTRLDDAVAALKRVEANLKRYRASVLKAACEGRLVPTEADLARKEGRSYEPASELLKRILAERRAKWEADYLQKMVAKGKPPQNGEWKKKYKDPVKPDAAHLPQLPRGWSWASLDDIAKIIGGVTKGQKRKPSDTLRSVPYLRVANVQRGMLDLSQIKTIEATSQEIEDLTLLPGDILLNEGGDRDKLGRGWIWEGQIPECIHQNHVFRARMVSSDVHPKYVSWYANSFGQQYFFDEGKQTTNLASLNMTKLKGLPVPLPPANEQARIVEQLEKQVTDLDSMERAAEVSAQRANILRQAVLKCAFAGKLVSQDPNDVPASVLLESICAEHDASKLQRVFDFDATPKKPAVSTIQSRAGSKWSPRSKKAGTL